MEFKEFAHKLIKIIGNGKNTVEFTRDILGSIVNEKGYDEVEKQSDHTFKGYFNGNVGISKTASIVLANLNEYGFILYLDSYGDDAAQLLADEFNNDIPGINAINATEQIKNLFLTILKEARENKGKGSKINSKNKDDVPTNNLDEQLLSVAQEVVGIKTYSSEDSLLLKEFISDYDDIMLSLIREDYSFALLENTNLSKIKDLYESKWMTKADRFQDPTLKSYVFGLLGELNKINYRFSSNINIRIIRTKIRNYYAKLHLGPNTEMRPYDAFIDDWNEGEF